MSHYSAKYMCVVEALYPVMLMSGRKRMIHEVTLMC